MRTLRNVSCLRLPEDGSTYHLHNVDVFIDPNGFVARGTMTLLYGDFEKVRFHVRLKTVKNVLRHMVPLCLYFGQMECFRSLLLSVDEVIDSYGPQGRIYLARLFRGSEVNEMIRSLELIRQMANKVRALGTPTSTTRVEVIGGREIITCL